MSKVVNSKNNLEFLNEDNIKKYVLTNYNLENCDVKQIKFKDTEKQRAVYMISDKDNTYCLKKVYYPIEDLLFIYSATEWLYRHKINVPRILSTKNHGRFVIYNNMLFILTPWVNGEKCDFNSQYEVILCAKTLGEIHKSSANFEPIHGCTNRIGCSKFYTSINKHFNNLLLYSNYAYKYKDNFSKLYLKNFDINIKLASFSNKIASTINENNLSTSMCHNDYVSKNLILDKEDNVWVIDFDKCKIDFCSLDIGYCLRRLLRKEKNEWSLPLTLHFLDEYEKSNSLNLDDYKYLLSYLTFPQKYWKISRDYYANINKCNKKSFIMLLKKSVSLSEKQYSFALKFKNYIEYKFDTIL